MADYHDLYLKTYVCLLTILDNTTILMNDFYYNMSRVSARWCSFFFIQMSLHENEGLGLGSRVRVRVRVGDPSDIFD